MSKEPLAYSPAPYRKIDIYALKALAKGEASEGQQRRVLDWIIQQAAGTYDVSYRSSSDRDTAFAEGRRFVGLQIVKLLNLPSATIEKVKDA